MAARKTPSAGGKPDKLMRDALSLELHQTIDAMNPDGSGRKIKIKRMRLVAIAMVNAALKGDVGAQKAIFERMDGRVPMEIRGGGKDGAFEFDVNSIKTMSTDAINALIGQIFASLSGPRSTPR